MVLLRKHISVANFVMEGIEEQRVCVKFCFKFGKSSSETFGDDALSRTTFFKWFKQFKEGRISVRITNNLVDPRPVKQMKLLLVLVKLFEIIVD
jgi:hypothetical protein